MKKTLSFLLSILIIILLVACQQGTDGSQKNETKEQTRQEIDAETSIDDADTKNEVMEIALTNPQPESTPEVDAMFEMAKQIEQLSGNKIKCKVYPNGQIGSIPESVQSVQMGVTQIAMAPCAIVASYCEDIALMDMPYLLPTDTEVISSVLNSELGNEFLAKLEPVGLHGLGFWFAGFRLMSANKDINSLSDMKGLKMRIMESNILTSTYKALGAQPIVIAYSETYNALSNGTVDGQENPAQSIYSMNFHEVQKYLIDTYHDAQTQIILVNKKWWDGLDTETQQVINKAMKIATAQLDQEMPKYTKYCIDEMVKAGCKYHALNEEQLEEFRKATSVVYDEFLNTDWRKDYITRLKSAFDEAVQKKAIK